MKKICKDCGHIFDDLHDLFKKCDLCQERDQYYRERAIEDELRDRIQQEDDNVNV